MNERHTSSSTDQSDVILYEQRPKPYSNALELQLDRAALQAERGRSNQRFPLAAIEQITLKYTPRNVARHTFTCHVQAKDGRSVRFENISWRSLIEADRLNVEYNRVVRTLIDRASRANPTLVLHGGITPLRYWFMLIVGVALTLALIGTVFYALGAQSALPNLEKSIPIQGTLFRFFGRWSNVLALFSTGLAAYLAYWLREYLMRNRPRTFAPETIPPELMPKNER